MARLSVVIAQSHSLKEKRMVLRRVKDRVHERTGIVMSEVGALDTWQRAELGCAVASIDRQQAFELLDGVVRVASAAVTAGDAQLIGVARDVIPFEAPPAPFVPVDDRTGAGDKAVAAADDDSTWIPAAWREEDAT